MAGDYKVGHTSSAMALGKGKASFHAMFPLSTASQGLPERAEGREGGGREGLKKAMILD